MSKNIIGLDEKRSLELVDQLNVLLAEYQVLYMNVRGYHWNIKGRAFFELHAKFEEIYNDLVIKIDEIAERILTLGGKPVHNYSQYLELSDLSEAIDINDGNEAIKQILQSYRVLLIKQRDILSNATDLNDEGTAALMGGYISQQEKETWMMNAYLQ
ncbi:DNA starvation/stationary phase protection protein [Vibrio sp. Isolate22]|uniref:Dps family protein n=1 Tax=Vibrio sp. Isolate22 TaxID=2908532 RepID=UPI001EFD7541|nr:Dps family protein [Vibrio sp. Isolate22]MCG9692590.1 DNA starvation/stationary phase protection protein [Vibrio sp. Isolate22]